MWAPDFNKISQTLGALNTVGRYIVNITKGQEPSAVNSVNKDTKENIPAAILTLTSSVWGPNVTKSIEPLIKRVGGSEVELSPEIPTTSTTTTTTTTTTVEPPVVTEVTVEEILEVQKKEDVAAATPSSSMQKKKKKKKNKVKRKDPAHVETTKKPAPVREFWVCLSYGIEFECGVFCR